MLIDTTKPIVTLDGDPIKEGDKDVTIGTVIVNALLAQHMGENNQAEQVSGSEKISRWELAGRVHNADAPIDLTVEEAAKIKKLVDKTYAAPLVYAQVARAIEASATPKAVKKDRAA